MVGDPLPLQSRPEFLKLSLDGAGGFQGVAAVLLVDDHRHARLAVDGRVAELRLRPLDDPGHVPQAHRCAAGRCAPGRGAARRAHDGLPQLGGGADLGIDPQHEPLAGLLLEPGPADPGRLAGRVENFGDGEVVGGQGVGVNLHLELPNLAAEEGDLGHPGDGEEAGSEGPLHPVAQLHRRERVGREADREQPAGGAGERPQTGRPDAVGKLPRHLGQPLGDELPGAVDVRPVAEDDRDDGQPLGGL